MSSRRTAQRRLARALPPVLAALALPLTAVGPARAADDAPVDGASYVIGATAGGGCLGPRYAQPAADAVRTACQGLLSQRWRLQRVKPAAQAAYLLVDSATGRCLSITGARTQPVRTAVTEDCGSGRADQQFTVTAAPGGGRTLAVRDNNQCLTVPVGAADLPIQARACDATPNQRWTLTRTEPLLLADPGFEAGGTGWTFSEHTGVAANYPHSGGRLAYLDAGTGYRVGQQITALSAGSFDLSAWIATGAPGGTLAVAVNGAVVRSLTLPEQGTYAKYTLPRITVAAGDRVGVTIGSAPTGWVNVDDLAIAPSAPNDPRISSSDPELVAMFDWAKTKANSWVQQAGATGVLNADENDTGGTSTGTYDTTYWAGYPFRSDFYIRDFAHQLVGAHLLGLDAQNKTMLRGFAASATDVNRLYPAWALNFDARTYGSIDYHSPSSFVRELPAPFELVQKTGEAYQWTGDREYAEDPLLAGYVRNTLGDFITLHPGPIDNGGIPIPQATSSSIFDGIASYAESARATYAEAGDALASQYQAYLAAATLATAKGDSAGAAAYRQAAATLKAYVNSTWSVDPQHPADVVHGYDTAGHPISDWGYETSVLMPMKKLLDPGPRLDAFLADVDAQDSGPSRSTNEEGYTYLPDTFFAGHDGERAWKWMRSVYDSIDRTHVSGRMLNGDYPELPFTLLSQTVQGLLGVQPDAAAGSLVTASELPAAIGWLQVESIPIGDGTVTLRQDGQHRSTLTNTGATQRIWEARFAGTHTAVTVDGADRPVRTRTVDGVTYTYATVTVAPGQTTTVAVSD